MHIHILGICGSFMSGIALLAKALGHQVSGSDNNVYPPMSTQLQTHDIGIMQGYDPAHLDPPPALVLIGNALSRGNAAVEHVLNARLPYTSGPAWLAENVLRGKWVLAVAGTHGKTTTASMLAWLLESGGLSPGFLVGGLPANFGVSARLGRSDVFVIEADEYDTAFWDKRSKFVHYRPRTLALTNIEYEHADIFPDLAAILRQFHHLVRTVPSNGLIILPKANGALEQLMAMGCWTAHESFGSTGSDGADWEARPLKGDFSHFTVHRAGASIGEVHWPLIGQHNAENALAAIAAARHVGLAPEQACQALTGFTSVKRRLECLAVINGMTVYDDFAHHPTAIRRTLQGLRERVGQDRIIALFEPRSNSMRMGVYKDRLAAAFTPADKAILYQPAELRWDLEEATKTLGEKRCVFRDLAAMIEHTVGIARPQDHILIMSNGAFGGLHERLIQALRTR
ncbi:MAG: UDP-N-acetylmuramate:L-alanyl-gamma-D-glutamyl-meso-diaminopimelate ligase [Gammaproteobacteria bacterium]|nr:UDP-N-acetylmuramate:L-alanyl-gamma-D-glutamyl-meso-diaminopimelate ligase [Gammaproteobacteria bacterium]